MCSNPLYHAISIHNAIVSWKVKILLCFILPYITDCLKRGLSKLHVSQFRINKCWIVSHSLPFIQWLKNQNLTSKYPSFKE